MKRQSILFILLLLLTLFICIGCSSAESAAPQSPDAVSEESAVTTVKESAPEEAAYTESSELEREIIAEQQAANSPENVENVSGIFEGLEDNHTALFSFDGVEVPFFFEDSAVQTVLSEAVMGSTYTLSYSYDDSLGLNVIYKISE